MRHILLLTAFMLLSATDSPAVDINKLVLSAKRISSFDGLSGNTVYDIVQDSSGFVWMGAAYGLCRYDGYSFVNYYSLGSDPTRKIDATTGNLYHDSPNALLWVHTSTFVFACYDLRQGRFIDYTGRGDETRPFRRFLRSGGDMWMYDTRSGIRHVTRRDGRFTCTDYTKENGRLPSNNVTRLVEDGRHNIWALTESGLLRIGPDGRVTTVVDDRRYLMGNSYGGNVLCLSSGNRVEMFSPDGRVLRRTVIPEEQGAVRTIRSSFVWQDRWMIFSGETYAIDLRSFRASKPDDLQVSNGLLLDSMDGYFFESNRSGDLWIFPPEGEVRKLSLLKGIRLTVERQRKYNVRRGRDGLFYIASHGNGLFIYDYPTGTLRHFSANDAQAVIDNDYLANIFIGRDGCLWVAQESAGVSRITVSEQSVAEFVQPVPGKKSVWANNVCMMTAAGSDGRDVILATKDNMMYSFDAASGVIKSIGETGGCVMARMVDRGGHEWIATRGGGLYVDGRNYNKYGSGHHIPSSDLYDLWEDRYGRVWIASYENGLVMTRYEKDGRLRFRSLLNRNINESRLHQFEPGPDGWLWIASSNGLYAVDTKRREITNDDFICFNTTAGGFPYDEMRSMFYDGRYLWTGGKGSGVVRCRFGRDMRLEETVTVTTTEGLADNTIAALQADRHGAIWAATENGLSRIYDKDMKVKTYRFGKSFDRNIYSENSSLLLSDGRLLFGTRYGLTVITPPTDDGSDATTAPRVSITDISINGVSAADSSLTERAVCYSDVLRLSHNENTLSLSFSNFEYAAIESALYQYYLERVEDTWRPMTSVNRAYYGNLRPGRYVFHIRSLADGRWGPERTLTVIIAQPWYNTWWAWLIYLVVASLFILYIYNNARERLRLHQQMKLEKQLTEFRLSFFTSITHEFRTPLAIIRGAIDRLGDTSRPPSKAALQTARRGTRRMLRLVDTLIEFRKVNTGNMRLQVEEGDIIDFVRSIYQDFWGVARQKEMHTVFTPFARSYTMVFDRRMVEMMVYNLMSNAVKYAPERGNVSLTVRKDGDSLVITVEDDGPGIGEEQQKSLFQPFMHGLVSQGGMGIGLYMVHSMAAIHHGTLSYRRVGDSGGSIFTITLPADASAYGKEDFKKAMAVDTSRFKEDAAAREETIKELGPKALNDLTIAIVEDDPDMMDQIGGEAGRYFHTDRYLTGRAALDGITARRPALVICDVMLPDMSGYDIVRQLKAGAATASLPVIMLTALDDDNHRMQSYDAGADDYMVKPCNFRLLMTRVVQLIKESRRRMPTVTPAPAVLPQQSSPDPSAAEQSPEKQNEVSSQIMSDTSLPELITSQADKSFLDRMTALTAKHISDPDFTVDRLADMLGMGRTKMFAKTKELTGMSPNKYLQNQRLVIAARLLAEGHLTVAEVSYRVGIKDSSYFNKCFKAKYGVVPSKYKG